MTPGQLQTLTLYIASFPGPAQLPIAFSMEKGLKVMESWAGPGNESTHNLLYMVWLIWCF